MSMLTDDNSIIQSDQSSMELNYSSETKASEDNKPTDDVPMDTGTFKFYFHCQQI